MAAKISGMGGSKFDMGQNSDINVTPFVDVMLVLLIIFMVAAPLATVAIKIDMPPPSPTPPELKKDPVMINVEQYGKLFLGAKEITRDNLLEEIKAAGLVNPEEEQVLIRANRYVPFKDFMDVLNRLQYGGYYKIALVAEDFL